ncbi:MAG: response regulator [Thermodesulfobacteriota bacterium]
MDKRILVVDDELLIQKSLQADIEQAGYKVSVADSGEEALEELTRQECHIIVTDLMMDGMGGIGLIEKIREQESDIPVIIITGHGALETAIEALRLGAADYLIKPFHTEELLLRIGNCLDRQEMERKIKLYEKFLPICAYCKKIRDDSGKKHGEGDWKSMEQYLKVHADLDISHGICPECAKKNFPEFYNSLNLPEDGSSE